MRSSKNLGTLYARVTATEMGTWLAGRKRHMPNVGRMTCLQGDTSDCSTGYVDIRIKVAFYRIRCIY